MTKTSVFNEIFSIFKRDDLKNGLDWFLLAGLGNPGKEYENNRHNIGFMVMNQVAAKNREVFSKYEKHALISKFQIEKKRLILVKPQTFMNRSGEAVGALVRYYKIPLKNLLIVYDDIDLPFGAIRIRTTGGAGGHKGLASVINQLGTKNFPRMRLGIGRPPGKQNASSYVLKDFSPSESDILEIFLEKSYEAISVFLQDGIEIAMNKYNSTTAI